MNLYAIKYLLFLIQEGEQTNKELSLTVGGSVSHASHALSTLCRLGVITHPVGRKSWISDINKPLVTTLEKLLLVSRDNPEIKKLLYLASGVCVGATFHKKNRDITISSLIALTGFSRISVMKTLKKMEDLNLIRREGPKPYRYYPIDIMLSQLFFEACKGITKLFSDENKKTLSPNEVIRHVKDEDSVLILVQYGSSVRKETDNYSDLDLFVVTRDKISRGEIVSCYSHKKIDLVVYSKNGFLELIRRQPDFVARLVTARILKGDDILKSLVPITTKQPMIIKQSVLKLSTDPPIKAHGNVLRGYIANRFPQHEIAHNHRKDGKLLYLFPRVQYRVIGEQGYVIGIGEGASLVRSIEPHIESIELKGSVHRVVEKQIISEDVQFGCSALLFNYCFIDPWLGLNEKNYHRYKKLKLQEDKTRFLKTILKGNLLSMSKGLGYIVEQEIVVKSLSLQERRVYLKGNPMLGFLGTFSVNFAIPDYWGIGKSVSRGFGTVIKQKTEHREQKTDLKS